MFELLAPKVLAVFRLRASSVISPGSSGNCPGHEPALNFYVDYYETSGPKAVFGLPAFSPGLLNRRGPMCTSVTVRVLPATGEGCFVRCEREFRKSTKADDEKQGHSTSCNGKRIRQKVYFRVPSVPRKWPSQRLQRGNLDR